MFVRTITESLNTWHNNNKRKPLILRGSKAVGKTTAVNALFSSYEQVLSLDLEKVADRVLFEQNYDTHELVSAIYFHKKQSINDQAKTLLFIDEIQHSPKALAMLRHLHKDRSDIHVIAIESLLIPTNNQRRKSAGSAVQYLWMYPLSFSEYLTACGNEEANALLQQQPCPNFAHTKLLKLFHEYSLVGGMPEAVSAYLPNRDILAANQVYEDLITNSINDVEKYAPNRTIGNVLRHAIQYAPREAGNRIKFNGFGQSNYKSREVGEALRLLEKTMLLHLLYPTTITTPPATSDQKKSPKLQFLDIGIMNYASNIQQHYFGLNDLNTVFSGKACKNIVGQELLANNISFNQQLKFWVRDKKQSTAEVDFLIPFEDYLIPIVVKSGKAGSLKSLMQYMELSPHPYSIRLHAGPIQIETVHTPSGKAFFLFNLPYYLAGKLNDYMRLLAK